MGAAAELENVPWRLASGVNWPQDVRIAYPTATFVDGRVAGSTGCNRYTAPYTLDGSALEIGMIAGTLRACAPPADRIEREYTAALQRVAGWRVSGDELSLLDADDREVLGYVVAAITGTWEATAIRTSTALSSPLEGTRITASFGSDGTLSGSSGCNTYRAPYTADRGVLEIGPPAGTRKMCPQPDGIMEQEAAYLAALPLAVAYRADGLTLDLLAADGTTVATYVRTASP